MTAVAFDSSAGTAGRGYRAEPDAHPFVADDPGEWGRRPLCRVCGREKPGHPERPRMPIPRRPGAGS